MQVEIDPGLLEPRDDFEATPERAAFTNAIAASMAWCLAYPPRLYGTSTGEDPHEIWGLPALGTGSDLERKWLEAVNAYEPFIAEGFGPGEVRIREDFNMFLTHIHMTLWGMRRTHCAEQHQNDKVWVGGLWEKYWEFVMNGPMKRELLIKFVFHLHRHYLPHCGRMSESFIDMMLDRTIAGRRR